MFNVVKAASVGTTVECSVSGFQSALQYEAFAAQILSSNCPSDFTGKWVLLRENNYFRAWIRSFLVSGSSNVLGSTATFNGQGFKWFLTDANNASIYYPINNFTAQVESPFHDIFVSSHLN